MHSCCVDRPNSDSRSYVYGRDFPERPKPRPLRKGQVLEIAKGQLTDRPYARTVFAVANKQFTGDLIVVSAGKEYRVTWQDGRVVAASSPAAADKLGRVALTLGLLDSSQLGNILRSNKQTELPLLDRIVDTGRLRESQILTLKNHALQARATRTFALTEGSFVLETDATPAPDDTIPPIHAVSLIIQLSLIHI